MSYLIASDIHGSAYYCRKLVDLYHKKHYDRLILLGDLLYHGPRNDLPRDYAPREVIPLLNALKDDILAVRGNCDAEVDQMVLDFPIMADYAVLALPSRNIYLSHGHVFHKDHLPPMKANDIFMQGHTHIPRAKQRKNGQILLNPGSIAIPKEDYPPSYAVLTDDTFTVFSLKGEKLKEISWKK